MGVGVGRSGTVRIGWDARWEVADHLVEGVVHVWDQILVSWYPVLETEGVPMMILRLVVEGVQMMSLESWPVVVVGMVCR